MYDNRIYYGAIVKGQLREAVDYLKKFPIMSARVKRYLAVFDGQKPIRHCKDKTINEICCIFDGYFRRVFWLGEDDGVDYLYGAFCRYLGADKKNDAEQELDSLEHRIAEVAQQRGYHYIGGKTQGYYGPYIWKDTKRTVYKIQLPHAVEDYPIDMLSGFACCSWMSHISFGKIGTGGWAGEGGVLACVKKRYRGKMHTRRFKVDFLKHEAQHALDNRVYPGISSTHLEYRAKLVQLIYAGNMKTFEGFLSEADASNPDNSHSVAAYFLTRNLSELIFGKPDVTDLKEWKGKKRQIADCALKLYDEYPEHIEA